MENDELAPRADKVDWNALSERSHATLRLCWQPLLLGYSPREIGPRVGVKRDELLDAFEQLREELRDSCC